MARLYDWEKFLTALEADRIENISIREHYHRHEATAFARERDAIRRRAVQRARHALNKQARAAMEKAK